MSAEDVKGDINFEISQIDNLLLKYADVLTSCREKEKPDLTEITTSASVLHSFYNGLENIFHTIAKQIDNSIPEGANWHKDLLQQIARQTDSRKAILTDDTEMICADFLAFRHFYRHSYSFMLDWDEFKQLVINLEKTWKIIKKEIQCFIENI